MASAALSLIVKVLLGQMETPGTEVPSSRFYYAARLIGALLIATLVPLLLDRRARRTSR
jgi:ABC-type cobalamin transport system permease subunit